MWGRVIEILTAVWLALSPYIFRVEDQPNTILVDSLVALAIGILSGLSFWKPTRHAHVAILAIALGLFIYGRFSGGSPPSGWHQNHIVVGFLLMMIAVIPNHASQPPREWLTEAGPSRD